MKVLLIIDHFGSGGAQRQMVELACGLRRRDHAVEMFVYYPEHNFFRRRLELERIAVHECSKPARGSLGVMIGLARLLRRGRFDVAASFLNTANLYAELARLAAPRTRLVVSERSSFHDDPSAGNALPRRLLHMLADRVVANSEAQTQWLKGRRWLRGKVSCIYNGVDLDRFHPAERAPGSGAGMRLLGVGRIGPEKNLHNLIAALARFGERFGHVPEIAWAGERDSSSRGRRYCEQLDVLLASLPEVQRHWVWLGLRSDIPELLQKCDALIHPSLYEGMPNAVCEALAAGRPVLASAVCDHPLLVADGKRGFLFDPQSPDSIVIAMTNLAQLGREERRALARNAREYAEAELGIERMVDRYQTLFAQAARRATGGGAPADAQQE
jgi:glycosyltransferase involved in cell wall biosynthesis